MRALVTCLEIPFSFFAYSNNQHHGGGGGGGHIAVCVTTFVTETVAISRKMYACSSHMS